MIVCRKFVFNRGVVGKALKGPICTFEYSGGVSMDHSTVVSLVATTVAHEMGHNFGKYYCFVLSMNMLKYQC